jgi:hypothetical protein
MSADLGFTTNQLVGQYFYLPLWGYNMIIVSNTATTFDSGSQKWVATLTLQNVDGSTVDLTGKTISEVGSPTSKAWIHPNADYYEIVQIPYKTDGTTLNLADAITVKASVPANAGGPTQCLVTMPLILGQLYAISIRGVNKFSASDPVSLAAGTYWKYSKPQTYGSPLLASLPLITSVGASVGAATTPFGFQVTIVGWPQATDFEICYSTNNAGANFQSESDPKVITSNRTIDITTSGASSYDIKVRPLMAGQCVIDTTESQAPNGYLETNVVSGAGGQAPNDSIIGPLVFDLETYTTRMLSIGTTLVQNSNTYHPFDGQAITAFPQSIVGSVITFNSTLISDTTVTVPATGGITVDVVDTTSFSGGVVYGHRIVSGQDTVVALNYTGMTATSFTGVTAPSGAVTFKKGDWICGNSVPTERVVTGVNGMNLQISNSTSFVIGAVACIINISERGRRIYLTQSITADIQITRMFLDCQGLNFGSEALMRWYQNTAQGKSQANTMIVNGGDTQFEQASNLVVSANYGSRDLVVDFFDTSSNYCNYSSLSGILTVYYRPYVVV